MIGDSALTLRVLQHSTRAGTAGPGDNLNYDSCPQIRGQDRDNGSLCTHRACVVTSRAAPFKHVIGAAIAAFSLYHQKTDGTGIPHAEETELARGESESDRAGAYQPAAIGASPVRTGAEQDISKSNGAGAIHTADRDRSQTTAFYLRLTSTFTGSEPSDASPLLTEISTARLVFHIKLENARLFCLDHDKIFTGRMPS